MFFSGTHIEVLTSKDSLSTPKKKKTIGNTLNPDKDRNRGEDSLENHPGKPFNSSEPRKSNHHHLQPFPKKQSLQEEHRASRIQTKNPEIKLISFTRVNHQPPSSSSIPALLPNSNFISPTHAAKLKTPSLPNTGKIQFYNTTNLKQTSLPNNHPHHMIDQQHKGFISHSFKRHQYPVPFLHFHQP
jgi:hypothetical protein